MKSKRGLNWERFSALVLEHVERYTVPQFGDAPNDQVEAWTAEDCIKAVRKYYERFGRGQRGKKEQLRDMLKIAHYASLAYEKMSQERTRT